MPVTTTLVGISLLVAVTAAVRSTWSPCGRSMLSSITPLAETARGNRFRTTAAWFVLGAAGGGACLGAVAAALAAGVRQLRLAGAAPAVVALAGAALVAVSDSGVVGPLLPVHHRQVNERWLDQFRAWVYGAGFGWQIGSGVATYVRTGAVYMMVLLGVLGGSPVWAFAACTAFGTVRGLAVLAGRGITSPSRLHAFHRRFAILERPVARATVAVEVVAAAALAVAARSAWPWVVAVLLAAAGGVALACALRLGRARSVRPGSAV
jgi:hypothetical protein